MKKFFAIMIMLAAIGILSSSARAVDQVPSLSGLTCGAGQIAQFNGANWVCGADVDTDTDTLAGLSCSAGQTVKFNGSAWVCDPPRFEVRTHAGGVQTVFDNDTGLEWEMKVSCGAADLNNPRCVENQYQWSSTGTAADGALFTDFLVKLNDSTGSVSGDGNTLNPPGCYAGHCDWRVPNIVELQTILLAPYPCGTSPCIDPVFGPTGGYNPWSSTTFAFFPVNAWVVSIFNGQVGPNFKMDYSGVARAVRGGR